MTVQIAQRSFTVDEYYRMAEAGIFAKDDRVELIEGRVITMSPIGSRHAACVDNLTSLFSLQCAQVARVRVQGPIRLDDYSEPEPDLTLLRPRADFYAQSHPTPTDVLLVVEVADTSQDYDRPIKVPLYAHAGIPEVWLVVLPRNTVEVYTRPVDGAYQDMRTAKPGEILTVQSVPSLEIPVDAILP